MWWAVRSHNDQATRANIAAQNAIVDHAIGRVVDAIEAHGLTEQTLVIVTTDQGNPYGQHGLWGHPPWTDPMFMHDVTFRVPLIFRQPGVVSAQRVNDRIVSHVDLFPTILEEVGLDEVAVPRTPGRSFAAAFRGEALSDWPDAACFENETARSIRTLEHLYTEHLDHPDEPELYDLIADPDQWHNVADRSEHRAARDDLAGQLHSFFAQFADPRYDLWNGGSAQAMVSRYRYFKERYGPDWEVTMSVPSDPFP